MTIFIIDDHPLFRDAISMLVRKQWPAAKVVELDRLGAVAAAVKTHGEPALICLDLKLADTHGASGVREMRARFPGVPLAVLSAAPAEDYEELCREAGADIYLEKSADARDLGAALRALVSPDSKSGELADAGDGTPSKRQLQMLQMLDQGSSNRDIAEQLEISEHTVKVHLWRLFKRIGVKSRTQAVHYARANGLLTLTQ